ncbi:hypothetical protein H8S37_03905 [Mediterraneibacter sp. NSJ-55]|uniref:Guanylate kinase-like domain-containing protein n=1 Tax=Mediterraneibacter hominis TaxID=2763054 RepID=A0A923LG33_9FIRM|nr:hypothetical protein [Mediterraneibacter hominis]
MSKPIKFLVLGRTASGKSSIAKEVCKRLNLISVMSYTTRPQRKSEKSGADHIFITEKEVKQYKNDIVAYTEINGYKYFTTFNMLDKSDVYVIDPMGLDNLKVKCGDRYKFIEIYIRTPIKLTEERAKKRGDDIKDFKRRYVDENLQFTEYENRHTFHYHLRNDRPFDESVDKVCEWVKNELGKE